MYICLAEIVKNSIAAETTCLQHKKSWNIVVKLYKRRNTYMSIHVHVERDWYIWRSVYSRYHSSSIQNSNTLSFRLKMNKLEFGATV